MKTIAFFNNKDGVGKTSLVYHLAWMYADLGLTVIAVDLDPQANLTSMFVPEDLLEKIWPDDNSPKSIYGAIQPLLEGVGDVAEPHIHGVTHNISLIPGDLRLSASEDELNSQWPGCLDRKQRAFRVLSAFYRVMQCAATKKEADMVLIDIGPNLGAINRASLISAQHVVIPLAPDIFSLQGLRNLGPTLRQWRNEWTERKERNPVKDLSIPTGDMMPAGYVVMQHAVRMDRPVKAYQKWMGRIPGAYRKYVMDENTQLIAVENDPYCLALLKHYRSLMPMAMEARKPMFFLKPADGAIGAHVKAVTDCYHDFKDLATKIAERTGIPLM
ncbi:MAG: AAA family ATPase [Candidatus Thiodiazotropha sp. (ex Dulcina madagascariensis)]|nr:AAA family ATPase [Candidatus Thiodiazotropha sp. (ex Dulcina madagascariensis)]